MTDKDYNALLNAASKKLGSTPEKLRSTIESGDMSALSAKLSKSDKAKLREVLANKQLMDKLKAASSPQEVMKLLGKT